MSRRSRTAVWVLICASTAVLAARASDPASSLEPRFVEPSVVASTEGHATLTWDVSGAPVDVAELRFELQKSRDGDFVDPAVLHEGPERSLFVAGLRDGRTWFRVRVLHADGPPGPWSEPLIVEVDYPGTGRVLLLLGVGCVVFLATVAAIVTGWLRRSGPGAAEEPA